MGYSHLLHFCTSTFPDENSSLLHKSTILQFMHFRNHSLQNPSGSCTRWLCRKSRTQSSTRRYEEMHIRTKLEVRVLDPNPRPGCQKPIESSGLHPYPPPRRAHVPMCRSSSTNWIHTTANIWTYGRSVYMYTM